MAIEADDVIDFMIDASIQTTVVVAAGGSVFYFLKGALGNSSSDSEKNDVTAGVEAFFANEPRIRRCAVWSGVMTAIDIGMRHVRQVEDPLNTMVAWGAANALFSVHRGPRAAVREALKGVAVSGAVSVALIALLHLVCCKKSSG
jgi:hypothetical protein